MLESRRARTLLTAVLAAAWIAGALAQAFLVNTDRTRHDQDTYLGYAQAVHDTAGAHIGNRLQMPALPTLLAFFTRTDLPRDAFFVRAKLVCVAIGLLASLATMALLRATLPRRAALALGLVTAFFVFAFRSAYVQAETLSYLTMFVTFLLALRLWRRPSWGVALALGALSGLSYLVKATGLLGLWIFCGCVVVREIVLAAKEGHLRARAAAIGQTALSVVAFAAVIYPYARNSKLIFGHWLHSMGSTYTMWCDSWEQYEELEARLHLNLEGQRLPPEQVPSLGNYVRSHTVGQMLWREVHGLGAVIGNCLISHGYALFAAAYLAFGIGLLVRFGDLRRAIFRRDARAAVWLVLPYLALHLLLFGWYAPISAGNRFSLGLFLPGMFAIAAALSLHARPEHRLVVRGVALDTNRFHHFAFIAFAAFLVVYYPLAAATHYSGG